MILIVASQVDPTARRLIEQLPAGSTALLTCLDLSSPGWVVDSTAVGSSFCVANGRTLEEHEIDGVLTLRPRVFEQELVHIHPDERPYVAAEMSAFLTFWLSTLSCPKLNCPTARCLSGPSWRPEQWLAAAADAGMTIKPISRSTQRAAVTSPATTPRGGTVVTVVGKRCLGDKRLELRHQARLLASVVGLDLVRVEFEEENGNYRFCGADGFPDLAEPDAANAIWAYFATKGAI